ncbi:hypothetical protein CBR_g40279 [Chara braunii]|uniref:Integrase catalytic domain-containing protein n=1 Tax=Chara braunii TaxID=69332 RepID=A0A388K1U9_CHABU|nr:hypothetical protein CBR_g40279 [Chara braunii]|eukprot:GBG64032.1 hypothetical protein CBR_g40279 [Chara braunii]
MQDTLDQILQALHKPGIRPAALPSLPLSAMTGLYAAQLGPPPSVSSTVALSQTVASSSSGPATVATPQSPPVSQVGQQYPWYPKTPLNLPATFSGDKKDEALDTWLRTVPVWVRAKRTLVEEEVITVASYLEGSAARWLNGLVASKGFGRNMHDWAQTHTLESFMDLVEARWHNPQQAHIATDGLLKLDTRKYKSVRELTTVVERLIVVPGVEYNPHVLLTMFLRCLPTDIRNLLVSEAFESFSKKALDLEATLGGAQTPSTDGRKKKTPQGWKKKGSRLMMVDSDGNQTEIDDVSELVEGSEFDGEESVEGSNLAAVVKTKAAGRRKGGQQRSQGKAANPNKIVAWVRAGLDQEVWRDRWSRGACINCVMAQQEGKKLRPIEYMSKKMPSKKLAKSTYERELYALYKALVHWRHYLLGRDVRFTSEMWKKAAEQMGSQLQMTPGNHPEANGQAEQMNRVVQHLLRHYIKPNQDDWDEKLPLIASLYNNAEHSTTGETVEHIRKSQEDMIASENKHRRQSTFQAGERVWVKASELGQEFGISRKLMPQYFGPWEVLDIVGNDLDGPSYVIRIPGHLRTYPVFHASKLALFVETSQFPSRRSMLPPTMDGHVDVDDILDH